MKDMLGSFPPLNQLLVNESKYVWTLPKEESMVIHINLVYFDGMKVINELIEIQLKLILKLFNSFLRLNCVVQRTAILQDAMEVRYFFEDVEVEFEIA